MVVYHATKSGFSDDVLTDNLDKKILAFFKQHLGHSTSKSEISSWKNSLMYMDRVLNDPEIPEDCGVAIEYQLPYTSKRLDFVITGTSALSNECVILVELKQWETAALSTKDAIIYSYVGKGIRELIHPCYQAWSYAELLANFSETIQEEKIQLQPCAYLHNYVEDGIINNPHYAQYLEKAPLFLRGDALKLRSFIKQFIRTGDRTKILYRIEQGRLRPSKLLADSITSMLKGNQEFVMLDDQKLVYETALTLAGEGTANKKKVLIVKGGPGTGKSVVAINLLAEITRRGMVAQYVSKNAAPRAVYEDKLKAEIKVSVISNLFKGSGGYFNVKPNVFDTLIVDEAHRLNEKSGLYGNLGENQVAELIRASRTTIFFIDEDQRVTLNDIGQVDEITKWADRANAEVTVLELQSQFRCNGSDGYLAWLDNVLEIRETANYSIDRETYDFQVFSSPIVLREAIIEKNKINNRSRMVAGYCWDWNSKKDPSLFDVVIPGFNFHMQWNLASDGSKWIIAPESVNEIGCIHTCQGLEVDYIGVVIGNDLVYDNGKLKTNPAARSKHDKSIFGYKKLLEKDPERAMQRLSAIIKNTYRTLMTRGMKGCYVYCTDHGLENYLRKSLERKDTLQNSTGN